MPRRHAPRETSDPARFFQATNLDDLSVEALADADAVWDAWDGDKTLWSRLPLPSPRLHPRAPEILGAAAGVAPAALRAVMAREAFIDEDGVIRAWPYYPEEQPPASRFPPARERLDEPFEPAYYLKRSTPAAIERHLSSLGVDAARATIDAVPLPPPSTFRLRRYEGGFRAPSEKRQAFGRLLRVVKMFEHAQGEPELTAQLEAELDRHLATVCDVASAPGLESEDCVLPEAEIQPIGRVGGVIAHNDGAILCTDGALIAIDLAGAFVQAWPKPLGSVVAAGGLAIINGEHVLDPARGFVSGDLLSIIVPHGIRRVPSTGGHDERSTPVLSPCGRYLLDLDESPYIVRLADEVIVADQGDLERALQASTKPGGGLLDPVTVTVGRVTVIDRLRFTVRSAEAPVRDGRALAFALCGDHWRFLVGDVIRERGKRLARIGVALSSAEFRADGQELWALSSDHAIRVSLDPEPAIGAVVLLEPILAAAAQALGAPR